MNFDGDEALNQLEFCVLMFRFGPELIADHSHAVLVEALREFY